MQPIDYQSVCKIIYFGFQYRLIWLAIKPILQAKIAHIANQYGLYCKAVKYMYGSFLFMIRQMGHCFTQS